MNCPCTLASLQDEIESFNSIDKLNTAAVVTLGWRMENTEIKFKYWFFINLHGMFSDFFLIIELEEGKQVFLSPLNHITLLFLDSQVFLYLIYFINIFKYFNINNFRVLESINQYSQHVLPVDLGLHIILNDTLC